MFRVYATTDQRMPPSQIAAHAARAERLGYDGLCVPEAVHDGLLAASIALQATARLHVVTGVLVAFPRSPMVVAHAAWDLAELSGGRFELGLGSQVRGNIVGRYSTPWSAPAPRMREYIQALRAIFATWRDGTPLEFEGEHYRFTRMQPFFAPEPREDTPPLWLGAVGPAMTAVAGEVADGLITHPTNSAPRYLREVLCPRVARGAARALRSADDVSLLVSPLVITGRNDLALAREREATRRLLGFLYSTPAYWPSLELFGWKSIGEELRRCTREARWDAMPEHVTDTMLDTFAPAAIYDEIPTLLRTTFGDLTHRITFPLPTDPADDEAAARAIASLRS